MCAFWGSLIRNVRKTKGYSAESVCEGLCSLSTYKKMESSGYEPRKYLYDAVMERLGIDPLLFKCVYANSDEKTHIRKLRCLEDTSKKIKITCATDEQFQYCVEMFNENLSGATVNTVIDALRLTHPDFNLGDLERFLYTK